MREPCSFLRYSLPATSSAVDNPNFAFSPPLVAHLPAPRELSRTRKPTSGSTFISRLISTIWRSSSIFSTTMMICLPSLRPSSAVWMNTASL